MRRVNREQMEKGGMRELSVSNRGRQEKIHDWVKKEFLLLFFFLPGWEVVVDIANSVWSQTMSFWLKMNP